MGNNPSYIWRSILAGQDILRQGIARRVGNGISTKFWGVPWLNDPIDPFVHTDCPPQLHDAKVANLLDNDGKWNVELLNDIFVESDVVRILHTPISPAHPDCWFWKGDLRGTYSVRHGYHLLTNHLLVHDPVFPFTEWKKLWRIMVPPKVRNFLWRAVRNVLPLRDVLRARGVPVEEGCCMCSYIQF